MCRWNPYASIGIFLVVLILAGCASTSLTNQWSSPDFSGSPLKKLMVVGVSEQSGPRRIFEDGFADALRSAGVQAVPSYTVIPEDGQANQAVLEQAVRDVGADGVLITRLVSTDTKTRIEPSRVYGPAGGFYGWYGSAWGGVYQPARVYQYDIVTAETALF